MPDRTDIQVDVDVLAIHEIGHALAAIRLGIPFKEVILSRNRLGPPPYTAAPEVDLANGFADKLLEERPEDWLTFSLAGPAAEVAEQQFRCGGPIPLETYFRYQEQQGHGWQLDVKHAREAIGRSDCETRIVSFIQESANKFQKEDLANIAILLTTLRCKRLLSEPEVSAIYKLQLRCSD